MGSPLLVSAYIEAYETKTEQMNYESWLKGLYVYNAVDTAVQRFAWGMNGCKGQKPEPYAPKPYPITERERAEDLEERKKKTLEFFKKGGFNGE